MSARMSAGTQVPLLWLAAGLLGLSFNCCVHGAEPVDKPGWSWPSAASNLAVQGEIRRQERFLTPQEHRNLQTVLEFLSGYGRLADGQRWLTRSPEGFHKPDHTLFQLLDDAFGANGYRDASLQDRINTVVDIVAKGDRVVALWRVNGTVNGPLFGFQGVGQPVEFLELMQFRFDSEGRILALDPWSADDLLFFEQLGGRVEINTKPGNAGAKSVSAQVAAADEDWSWPTAAASPALRAEILRQPHTAEERRNIQTVLEFESGLGRALDRERWYAKDFRPPPRSGYQELDSAFGRNDYHVPAIVNRRNRIEDIVAKGNRVVVVFRTTGNLNAPIFGFDGLGQPIDVRELLVMRFNEDGLIAELWPWGEGFVLYQELGGVVKLPGAQP